jgi:hypothetical protein
MDGKGIWERRLRDEDKLKFRVAIERAFSITNVNTYTGCLVRPYPMSVSDLDYIWYLVLHRPSKIGLHWFWVWKFEVFLAVELEIMIIWVLTPYGLVGSYQYSSGTLVTHRCMPKDFVCVCFIYDLNKQTETKLVLSLSVGCKPYFAWSSDQFKIIGTLYTIHVSLIFRTS